MTRTGREIAAEVLRRAALREKRGGRLRNRIKAAGLVCVFLGLSGLLAFLPGGYADTGPPAQAWTAAPLIFEGAGGYILTGAACFAIGAAVTLLCLRSGKQRHKGKNGETSGSETKPEIKQSKTEVKR